MRGNGYRRAVLTVTTAMALAIGATSIASAQEPPPPWTDTSRSPAERADLLLNAMTLAEKVDMVAGDSGPYSFFNAGIPRLGIPEQRMADAGGGLRTFVPTTAFPSGIALGATWNPDVAGPYGSAVADEVLRTGQNVLLGPNADLVRLPWWGRTAEAESEDPVLTEDLLVPYIRAVQEDKSVIADIKHPFLYNQETNRGEGANMIADERTIRELHTRPLEGIVDEARVGSAMCSFNKVNGDYACENDHLLNDVLKGDLGFDGWVLSDFGATHSTVQAANAGLDQEMAVADFFAPDKLIPAIENGDVPLSRLNDMVYRQLFTMFRIGTFELPQPPQLEARPIPVAAHGAVARKTEEEAITLLKNRRATLPLPSRRQRDFRRIALVGGDANWVLGSGGAPLVSDPTYRVTPLDGIRARAEQANVDVDYEPGTDPVGGSSMLGGPAAVSSSVFRPTGGAPSARGLRAEWFANLDLAGDPAAVTTERQANVDFGFLGGTFIRGALNPSQNPAPPITSGSVRYSGTFRAPSSGDYSFSLTGFGSYRMLFDGEVIIDSNGPQGPATQTSATLSLVAGEPHEVVVEYAATAPVTGLQPGSLQLGWSHPANAIAPAIQAAAAAAGEADVAIVVASTFEGENRDRADLTLPNEQDLLIREVRRANPRTVVVLNTGGPVLMPWLGDVRTVLQTYYGGQEVGNALASVLFGNVNPSGKLPITYPSSETAVPPGITNPTDGRDNLDVEYREGVFMGYRGYDESGIEPLFPFGHGLSYTAFRYRGLRVDDSLSRGRQGNVDVSFRLRNTGNEDGAEVAQVYVGRLPTDVPTPPKQLAGFAKVNLDAGSGRRVTVEIKRRELSYWSDDLARWVTPTGVVPVYVGSSSRDVRLTGSIRVR